ncbi:MAG: RidA family protein [Betaproteobacteria bacterium]|nr:RidA family protein [Betaproteobacteria bacterium]
MASVIETKLAELGIMLPNPGAPGGNYVPFVIVGDLAFLSGQVARAEGKMAYAGKIGGALTVEQGQAAARLCALNLLAQLKAACDGNLDRVARCVRLSGFVNCGPDFKQQPQVVNGASDLMVAVLGERGRHARTAVGVASLPGDSAVEVEGIFQLAQE